MMPRMMTSRALRQAVLPSVSYGPFRLLEAVPWLMLASSMRFLSFAGGPLSIPAGIFANVALLLAFVIVAWRMVLISDGRSGLGRLGFRQQLAMARTVLLPVLGLLIVAALVAKLSLVVDRPEQLMFGFDGIAFDQLTHIGRLWSAVVAALLLLMVLQVDEAAKPSLFRAIGQFAARALWLVPAVLLVAVISILLHPVQTWFRGLIWIIWQQEGIPMPVKNGLYFGFVFLFATVRLWLTVSILVLALRQSYRDQPSA